MPFARSPVTSGARPAPESPCWKTPCRDSETGRRDRETPRSGVSTAVVVALVLILVACGGGDDTWVRIQETGVLRVGLDPSYPPFEVATADDLWGLDVDLARALGEELGLSVVFSYFGYDGLYDALGTGQVDVLASALVVQIERTRDVAYSRPYVDAGQILIVPEGSPIAGPDDLDGRVLAVELGAQGHVAATGLDRRLPDLTIIPAESVDRALDAVAQGAADAALVDAVGGRLYMRGAPGLTRLPAAVESEPYALVVRAEDRELLKQLNAALERLAADGRLAAIVHRWLDEGGQP